ncbi:MAG TPA: ABC transporter permease [Candidatus Bathyarchaeia archaeon]|nr:ABC transporter permease [Candidatus Bathyarchaeia archaeon]
MPQNLPFSQRLFRTLVRLLPFDFRTNYEGEMEAVFHAQRREAEQRGGFFDALRLWKETVTGIFTTAPREHWQILRSDCSYAFRMMHRNLGFTLIAVLTLALGIGANTAIFSVVHSVVFRELPYPDGHQLIYLRQQEKNIGQQDIGFSVPEIMDYRAQNRTLAGLVEYHNMNFTLFGHGDPERVQTGVVSSNFFDLFGVSPLLGRAFLPDDEKPDAPPVLVLSYEYWKNNFGSDPNIVGKTFEMNDKVHTVVGVLPPVPQYPDENDVYMPTSACPFRSNKMHIEGRDMRMMEVFARVKPGLTVQQASADISAIGAGLQAAYPKFYPENVGFSAAATPLRHELTKDARPTLFVLLACAAFVLLIACANVANLTLSRMARRERELAVRTALGAGRSRLLRQLLTESFLIAGAGGALGLLLTYGTLELLTDFVARLTPRAREIHIDSTVLLFTLLAALATTLVFGTLSALFSRANVANGLKEGSAGAGTGRQQNRLRSVLIVCQVAFSFLLLIGAGLMLRSLYNLQQVNAGIAAQRVLVLRTNFNWTKYTEDAQTEAAVQKLLDRVQSEPGVLSAAISSRYPFEPEMISAGPAAASFSFQIEGRTLAPGQAPPVSTYTSVSTDYFKTLGIPLKAGRLIADTDSDKLKAPLAVLINETAKKLLWPNEDPLGKRISPDGGQHWATVVGIVGDVREFGLDHAPSPEFYVPQMQAPQPAALVVRTAAEPAGMGKALTRAIHDVDPQTAVNRILTLEQARYRSLSSPRVIASLLGVFAGLALVIATAGIGGIMALMVSQRVREIGIRIALGARPVRILQMILGQGFAMAALGVALGIAGAVALTGLVKSLLFEVAPNDVWTFSAVGFMLLAAAALASYLPARRAASIDPNVALRAE